MAFPLLPRTAVRPALGERLPVGDNPKESMITVGFEPSAPIFQMPVVPSWECEKTIFLPLG